MKKYLEITFVVIVAIAVAMAVLSKNSNGKWSTGFSNGFGCNTEDITNMYADYIEIWKKDIGEAFDKAEAKIIDVAPDEIVGPHPDPKKCICQGSGIIVHGDGHKTICPYHGKKQTSLPRIIEENNLIFKSLLKVE